ncbi:MAG: hypothetical protein U1F40_12145 [Turneriella sp.]
MKVTQELSEEYIRRSQQLTVMERLEFLQEYRLLLPLSVFEEHYAARLKAWYGSATPPEE